MTIQNEDIDQFFTRRRTSTEWTRSEEFNAEYRRLQNGFYVPTDVVLGAREWIAASWRSSGGAPVIGGMAATIMHGSPWYDPEFDVELFRHAQGSSRAGETTLLHRTELAKSDVVEIDGLPVTSPIRTAFDIGRRGPRWRALGYLDALQRASGFSPDELARYTESHRGRRGVRMLRELTPLINGLAESPPESWTRLVMHDAGLPKPDVQIEVLDEHGNVIARIDLGYKDFKVGIEYNGKEFHSSEAQIAHDAKREEMLTGRGWDMHAVESSGWHDGQIRFVHNIFRALRARGGRF